MAFRINSPIDSNQHKGLLGVNSINGNPLAITGLSLTNAQPVHVAIVDSSGSQVVPAGSGSTGDVNIVKVGGATVSLGQATMASSFPVTIASNQSSLPVTLSGSEINIGQVNVLDTTDTEINPAKEDGNLAAIKTDTDKIPSQGAAATANSTPVNIASDQTVPTTLSDIYLALKSLISVMVSPPWMVNGTGALRVETYGQSTGLAGNVGRQWTDMAQVWNSTSSTTGSNNAGFSPTDSFLNPLSQDAWANNIRMRIA